ncbi:MAG: hypothetical protein LUQ11_04015 [Methylococcaceae bacterium]|nr:hypothetical protein [Methylococcaceae bacterium]
MPLNLKIGIILGLLTASHVASANVWSPTASDVNFLAYGPFSSAFSGWTQTGTIGIFEDNVNVATSTPVAKFSNGATVTFTPNGSNWDIKLASMGADTLTETLAASNQFQLGWLSNGKWIPEAGNNSNPWTPNFWQLTFIDGSLASNNTETLYATNIKLPSQLVDSFPLTTVPLPAAAWSFMLGIMGLLAIGKRRQQ